MTNTSKTIVFFGNERLVSGLEYTDTPVLKGLVERGYNIAAVVSHHTESRSRKVRELEVAQIAEQHDIPVYLPEKPTDIADTLKALKPDAAVLVAYGKIIPQSIIDIFPLGIINIHPSLLPLYRGPTPIESAILHGDSKTGVSIMQLSAGMDDGPVYVQQSIGLRGDESKLELYEAVSKISADLLFKTLPNILDTSLQPIPQDHTQASYSQLLKKSDSVIDWHKPAIIIEREIRAYLDWPGSRTQLGSLDAVITSAHSDTQSDLSPGELSYPDRHTLRIGTAGGSLYIDTLKPLGKKEMPIQAFLAGYKSKLSS